MTNVFDTGGLIGAEKNYVIATAAFDPGEIEYTASGTYTWTAPANVTNVCVVVVGGGGGGGGSGQDAGSGGGGGALSWKNNISVTPGASYEVVVGIGGPPQTGTGTAGGQSYFSSPTVVSANGGSGGTNGTSSGGAGGTRITGAFDGGGNGGQGGNSSTNDATNSTPEAGAGGGAGGYSGNGGRGAGAQAASLTGESGSGGGGGGGGSPDSGAAGGGGGVGLQGEGASGAGGTGSTRGGGGSGGNGGGTTTNGGADGGGGAGADGGSSGFGATGGVRIIWGEGRNFPNTNTGDGQGIVTTRQVESSGVFNLNSIYAGKIIPNVVKDGLILYLDTSVQSSYPRIGTRWSDLSANNNNGTIKGNPVFSTDNGGTFILNGDDHISLPLINPQLPNNSTYTVSCWVNFNDLSSEQIIWSETTQNGFGDSGTTFEFNINRSGSPGILEYTYISVSGQRPYPFVTPISGNTWYNITVSRGPSTIKTYVNGVVDTSNTTALPVGTVGTAHNIGKPSDNTRYFIGNFAVGLIYNRELSETEVIENFNATRSRFGV